MIVVGPSINQSLESLKNILDPRDQAGINLLVANPAAFNEIIGHFKNVFEPNKFKDFGSTNYQVQHQVREQQLEAVWLYMAFSMYIRHWAQQSVMINGQQKLAAINELDLIVAPCISIMNDKANYSGSEFYNHSISYHQKQLMVNGNLFVFIQNLISNPGFNGNIASLPISLDQTQLSVSKRKAQRRTPTQSTGHWESTVNAKVEQTLAQTPGVFQPIPKVNGIFIDNDSGLELDFPLTKKVSFETDGIHHTSQGGINGASTAHSIVHNLKSFLLRENGWTRVAVSADQAGVRKASLSAQLLQLPQLAQFSHHYEQITHLWQQVKDALNIEMNSLKRLSFDDKMFKVHSDYITQLLLIDKNIRILVNERAQEKLLRLDSPAFNNTCNIDKTSTAMIAYQAYLSANNQIQEIERKQLQKDAIYQSTYGAQIQGYKDKLVQLNDKEADINQKLKRAHEVSDKYEVYFKNCGKDHPDYQANQARYLPLPGYIFGLNTDLSSVVTQKQKLQAELQKLEDKLSLQGSADFTQQQIAVLKAKATQAYNTADSYFKSVLYLDQLPEIYNTNQAQLIAAQATFNQQSTAIEQQRAALKEEARLRKERTRRDSVSRDDDRYRGDSGNRNRTHDRSSDNRWSSDNQRRSRRDLGPSDYHRDRSRSPRRSDFTPSYDRNQGRSESLGKRVRDTFLDPEMQHSTYVEGKKRSGIPVGEY